MTKEAERAEKRQHPRFAALSPALVVGDSGVTSHCLVEDLSAGGALVSGGPTLNIGEAVRLLLQLPGRGPFSLDGKVVRQLNDSRWQREVAFGIAFSNRPPSAVESREATVAVLDQGQGLADPVVLVVDDNTRTCYTLVQDLQRVGRKAIAVTTPLDAIEWLLDGGSQIDTAMVDIVLGHSNGCDLLTFLADEYPDVRRVLMSDHLRAPQLETARELAQPHAILHKPWNETSLREVFTALAT